MGTVRSELSTQLFLEMLGKVTLLLDPRRPVLKFPVEAARPFEKTDQRLEKAAGELRAMNQRDHVRGRHRLEKFAFLLFALQALLELLALQLPLPLFFSAQFCLLRHFPRPNVNCVH